MKDPKKNKANDHYLRHRFLWKMLRPIGKILAKWKLNYSCVQAPDPGEPFILLSNHCTDWDPILVGLGLPSQGYFVASEHITRWKVFPVLRYIFEPIIRYKGTVGITTVKEILRKAKDRKNVAFFPEGVRTFTGETMPIPSATAGLIKRSGSALITYRLKGGYLSTPNWSETGIRKGKIWGEPVRVFSSEQLKQMSVQEVEKVIQEDLYEDAFETQRERMIPYKGMEGSSKLAEKLENILFICPECHQIHTLHSVGNRLTCSNCQAEWTYDEYGMLTGRFKTVTEWCRWQKNEVEQAVSHNQEICGEGTLSQIEKGEETLLKQGKIQWKDNILSIEDISFEAAEIPEIEIHGKHELVFSCKGKYYELHVEQGAATAFLWFVKAANEQVKSSE